MNTATSERENRDCLTTNDSSFPSANKIQIIAIIIKFNPPEKIREEAK